MGTARQQEQARPMRYRLSPSRVRAMARRSMEDERLTLSPRARRIAGWVAAILLVLGIAVVVRVLGGSGDGAPTIGAGPSGSGGPTGDVAEIDFGTALDETTGQVAEDARASRFATGDTFAYSVAPRGEVPAQVYVEVRRTDGTEGVAQEPVDAQTLPDPRAIAFTVPAEDLLAVFGPGTYLMLIYAEPGGTAIAEGTFELVSVDASPAASPSASP
jgi:hypothetical protein